jgi:hypothetical protein
MPDHYWAATTFDLSPDGRYVARTCPVVGGDELGSVHMQSDLVVQDVDGSGSRTLWRYSGGEFAFPAWSPDGSRLAVSTRGGIVILRADGTDRRTLVPSETLQPAPTLVWAPNGDRLLTSSFEVIDLATGVVSHPFPARADWPGGAASASYPLASYNAMDWSSGALWWIGEFGSMGTEVPRLNGVWSLNLTTRELRRELVLNEDIYPRVERVGDGWWALTRDGDLQHFAAGGALTRSDQRSATWLVSAVSPF